MGPGKVRKENEEWAAKYRPLLKKRDEEKEIRRNHAKDVFDTLTEEQQEALRPYLSL
tara:strand:- start:881 stop:1051 length:171 start_codon:yes stop_codon:yes gene_type:complete